MAFRTWGRLLLTALGVSVLAGAGQLGVAYGFGIVRLTGAFTGTTVNQWPAQLVWVGWFAANAAVAGAVLTGRLARSDAPAASTRRQLAIGGAAALGATVIAPLCMQPARAAELISVDPVWAVGICAVLGAVIGAGAAIAVLLRPELGWNMAAVAGVVWVLALISVLPSLGTAGPVPTVRLGVLEPSWLSDTAAQRLALLLLPTVALLAGAATAGLARWRGQEPLISGATGVAGPVLVAFAYLTAGPGDSVDRYQVNPYYGSLIAILAGALGAAAAALLRWPTGARTADSQAIEPSDILRALPTGPALPNTASSGPANDPDAAERAAEPSADTEPVGSPAGRELAGTTSGPRAADGPDGVRTVPAHWDWPATPASGQHGAAPAAPATSAAWLTDPTGEFTAARQTPPASRDDVTSPAETTVSSPTDVTATSSPTDVTPTSTTAGRAAPTTPTGGPAADGPTAGTAAGTSGGRTGGRTTRKDTVTTAPTNSARTNTARTSSDTPSPGTASTGVSTASTGTSTASTSTASTGTSTASTASTGTSTASTGTGTSTASTGAADASAASTAKAGANAADTDRASTGTADTGGAEPGTAEAPLTVKPRRARKPKASPLDATTNPTDSTSGSKPTDETAAGTAVPDKEGRDTTSGPTTEATPTTATPTGATAPTTRTGRTRTPATPTTTTGPTKTPIPTTTGPTEAPATPAGTKAAAADPPRTPDVVGAGPTARPADPTRESAAAGAGGTNSARPTTEDGPAASGPDAVRWTPAPSAWPVTPAWTVPPQASESGAAAAEPPIGPDESTGQTPKPRHRVPLPDLSRAGTWNAFDTSRRAGPTGSPDSSTARPATAGSAAASELAPPTRHPVPAESPVVPRTAGTPTGTGEPANTTDRAGTDDPASINNREGTDDPVPTDATPAAPTPAKVAEQPSRRGRLGGLFRRNKSRSDEKGSEASDATEALPAQDEEFVDWVAGLGKPVSDNEPEQENGRRSLRSTGRHHRD
ncbi:hypothetical protein ABZU25_27395 [Micromonospora sp. NPDC005215]|uniref:hypothetical protein n=1 Tax=Micromonospora sp. NPDC005215 TaxID=3157024 RepID=UPI0033B6F376